MSGFESPGGVHPEISLKEAAVTNLIAGESYGGFGSQVSP